MLCGVCGRGVAGGKGGETDKRGSHSVTNAAAAALTKHQDVLDSTQTASRQLSVFLKQGWDSLGIMCDKSPVHRQASRDKQPFTLTLKGN